MVHRQGAHSHARVIAVLATAALAVTVAATVAGGASDAKRPEGPWTLVDWEVARQPPNPQYVPGTANVVQVVFSPRCSSGPCAVRVRGGGRRGTYVAAGAPISKSDEQRTSTLAWNAQRGVYTVHRDYGQVLCTTSDGAGGLKRVPKGYTRTGDATYRFRRAKSAGGASIVGETITTATGSPQAVPQGCTNYSFTSKSAGAPTGAVHVTAAGAAGQYRITEIVDRTEGSGQRPHGFSGILVPNSTVAANGRALTITGIVGTATLRPTRAGWTGSVRTTAPSCVSTSTEPGYTTTETWTGVHPLARTETGDPVLAGTWRYVANPNASGVHDGCSLVVNQGYVILVPMGAITP
jgi:hypothetical protein